MNKKRHNTKQQAEPKPPPRFDPAELFFKIIEDAFRGQGLRQPSPFQPIVNAGIPSDMMKKLLMLCHPDKHGNSELSNEVTRWLIGQKKL